MYRFFDLRVDSQLALPGLPAAAGRRTDWSIAVGTAGAGYQRFHTWRSADGSENMWAGRNEAVYLLAFPGLARFAIDFSRHAITAEAAPGCDDQTLAHLLLDQALPRAVCHEGRCVLHASAVEIGGGVVAFTGISGSGKSTLAGAFHRAGYPVLADDCLLVEPVRGVVRALAAYPSLRLWPDAASALFSADERSYFGAADMASYSNKQVLRVGRAESPSFLPLRALYLLDRKPGRAGRDSVTLEPADGQPAIMGLIEAQFALDVVGRDPVVRNFESVRGIAGRVPVVCLTFPRNYEKLGRVIETVLRHTGADRAAEA